MKKILILILIATLVIFAGCQKKVAYEDIIGEWKVTGFECEEEDLKDQVASGSIKIKFTITENEMVMSANDYSDPPLAYEIKDGEIVFSDSAAVAEYENGVLTIDMHIEDHTYSYKLEKAE